MSRIRILSQALADKIAAGEVVERPASVVKELVENALDAGARHVRLDILSAGKRLIQVSDDGCGMTREEASLSVRRHATSKIQGEEDLFRITTLGFRGEALPSIAAVAKLTIETKAGTTPPLSSPYKGEEIEGTRVTVHGGDLIEVASAGLPAGTRVSVADLFYNTPARLKFMKSDGVELGHMEDAFLNLALGKWDCGFELFIEEKQKWISPRGQTPLARVRDCLGSAFVEDCLEISEENPEIGIGGWVVHPRQTAGNGQGIHFYLNGRFLRDRVLQHALAEGFGDFLMKGRYPKAVLYLRMPPEEVDVNVHPAKREVRFRRPQAVHQFVSRAVKKALQRKIYGSNGEQEKNVGAPLGLPSPGNVSRLGRTPNVDSLSRRQFLYPPQGVAAFREVPSEDSPSGAPTFFALSPGAFSSLHIIGSLADTYIVTQAPDCTLVLIDQHAAHERIGYEKLQRNFGAGEVPSQKLLIPLTWEATAKQSAILQTCLENLNGLGLVLEPFGGNAFRVLSVPLLLRESQVIPVLERLVEELEEESSSRALEARLDHVLKTFACHSQVRAGDPLSLEELRHLLSEMDTFHATHCPHGRPTFVEIPRTEIEKWFKRV